MTKQSLNRILLILLLLFLLFLSRNVLIYRPLLDVIDVKTTTGTIINEKEYSRRSHLTNMFSYYYEFEVNGKKYKNPSYDEKFQIGQTVNVEYSEKYPFMNRIRSSN
jgi:hypothetical protein